MNEQPLNLKGVLKVIRRRRHLVVLLVVLGLVAGTGYGLYKPPLAVARALVILPSSLVVNTGDPAKDDATQVIVATSTPVLASAGASVSPPIGPAALKGEVVVSALSEYVLQVQVTTLRPANAERLANAVADDYIAYATKANSTSNAVLAELRQESARITHQVQQLQSQINATSRRLAKEGAASAAGQRDTSLLRSLRSDQEEVSVQLNNVTNQIFSTQLSSTESSAAIRILQTAIVMPTSKLRTPESALAGALAGLLIACLWAIFRSRRDECLHLRDAIAATIGVPVLASVDAPRCSTVRDWKKFLGRYRPSPVDVWTVRRLLHRVAQTNTDKQVELSVLAFSEDEPALVAGVQFARSAAALGVPALLRPGDDSAFSSLRAACAARHLPAGPDGSYTFEREADAPERSGIPIMVSLHAVGTAKPPLPGPTGSVALLAVSAGFPTAEALARLALAIADTGCHIDGVLVVNPDPDDGTTGALPQVGEARRIGRRSLPLPSAEYMDQPR